MSNSIDLIINALASFMRNIFEKYASHNIDRNLQNDKSTTNSNDDEPKLMSK